MLIQSLFAFSSLILSSFVVSAQITFPVKDPKNITFAFGSCANTEVDLSMPIFENIVRHNPDIFTWIGDIIYIESNRPNQVAGLYQTLANVPGFQTIKSKVPMIGIWDDHDFGPDNGDKYYPYKERNKQYFLEFIGEPLNSMRWHRDGLYTSYYIGEEQQVKIILADTRYNKDPRMSFNSSGDMLGETQWQWLENELQEPDNAKFTLITSGVQLIPDDRLYPETWYTSNKERLISLIRKTKRSGVIILSGDVHFSEIMEYPCPERVGYRLTEFTSSGLTHYLENIESIINSYYPDTYSTPDDRYFGKNYGIIRFIFKGEEPVAILETWNSKGKIVLTKTIPYSQLRFDENMIDMQSECIEDKNKIVRFLRFIFTQFGRGNIFAIALVLVCLLAVLIMILCWIRVIIQRINRKHKRIQKANEMKSLKMMKYKYASV